MSSGQKGYSIVVADDHEVVRAALRRAFETPGLVEAEGLDVVAEAMTGREALAAVKRHKPSLVTLDVSMPDIGGHEVIHELRRWSPQTRIVVFTGVTAPGLISSLVQSGAEGLFSKSGTSQGMLDKLPHILRGGRFVDERFLRILENEPNTPALTAREHQVLNLLVSGRSNREISEVLGISSKTVEKHRGSLMGKLNVNSIAQLLARALKDGLIDPAREL
jgi:DNA-binding NarL/FixJ family response regulator